MEQYEQLFDHLPTLRRILDVYLRSCPRFSYVSEASESRSCELVHARILGLLSSPKTFETSPILRQFYPTLKRIARLCGNHEACGDVCDYVLELKNFVEVEEKALEKCRRLAQS